jgi:thioredoxin 1
MTPLEMKAGVGFSRSSKRQAEQGNAAARPRLLFFHAPTSGRCRRAEGHLAHALQRRRNHATFELVRVNVEERPELAERFRVDVVPTLLVVEDRRVVRRIVAPRSALELERGLEAWLR